MRGFIICSLPALLLFIMVFLSPLSQIPANTFGDIDAATDSPGVGQEVGPMADTTPPRFDGFDRPQKYVGPNDNVSVLAYVTDESVTNTTLYYGYNNSTW